MICKIYSFLTAAKGNWRNAVFIKCENCVCAEHSGCFGFLMIPDSNGQPVVIPAGMIREMTGLTADKEECIAVISREQFETLYALWLEWQIDSPHECVLLQISGQNNMIH